MADESLNFSQVHVIPLQSKNGGDDLGAYRLINVLLRRGFEVLWATAPVETADGQIFPPGTFVVPPQLVPRLSDQPSKNLLTHLLSRLSHSSTAEGKLVNAPLEIEACRLTRPRLAIYNGETHRAHFVRFWIWAARALERSGFLPDFIDDQAIREGRLPDYDVFLMPGGSALGKSLALGPDGLSRIKEFVEAGGGYIGVCAGTYLPFAPNRPNREMQLLAREILINRPDDGEGHSLPKYVARGFLNVRSSEPVHPFLWGHPSDFEGYYENGPILSEGENISSVARYGEPTRNFHWLVDEGEARRLLLDNVAIAAAKYGRGKMALFAMHPEHPKTPANARLLANAVLYLSARGPYTYPLNKPFWVTPKATGADRASAEAGRAYSAPVHLGSPFRLVRGQAWRAAEETEEEAWEALSSGYSALAEEAVRLKSVCREIKQALRVIEPTGVGRWYINDLVAGLDDMVRCAQELGSTIPSLMDRLSRPPIMAGRQGERLTRTVRLDLEGMTHEVAVLRAGLPDMVARLEGIRQVASTLGANDATEGGRQRQEIEVECHLLATGYLSLIANPTLLRHWFALLLTGEDLEVAELTTEFSVSRSWRGGAAGKPLQ